MATVFFLLLLDKSMMKASGRKNVISIFVALVELYKCCRVTN